MLERDRVPVAERVPEASRCAGVRPRRPSVRPPARATPAGPTSARPCACSGSRVAIRLERERAEPGGLGPIEIVDHHAEPAHPRELSQHRSTTGRSSRWWTTIETWAMSNAPSAKGRASSPTSSTVSRSTPLGSAPGLLDDLRARVARGRTEIAPRERRTTRSARRECRRRPCPRPAAATGRSRLTRPASSATTARRDSTAAAEPAVHPLEVVEVSSQELGVELAVEQLPEHRYVASRPRESGMLGRRSRTSTEVERGRTID